MAVIEVAAGAGLPANKYSNRRGKYGQFHVIGYLQVDNKLNNNCASRLVFYGYVSYPATMGIVRKIAMLPVWLLQVFGQSKSFAANPLLGNAWLNRLGLHAIRLTVAHAMRRVRQAFIAPFVGSAHRAEFWRNGFVVVEDFLPAGQLDEICKEITQHASGLEIRECVQGDTLTHRILLDENSLKQLPAITHLVDNRKFRHLLNYVAASFKRPLYYIQRTRNGHNTGTPDPQKALHSDTFHPTMKAWFFLDDVTIDMGPFTYVPGSHRLTTGRLKWEYRQSIRAHELDNSYSRRGSLRADDKDLKAMGYPTRKTFAVRKNTLVVADTHGFHCRGQAEGKASRLEIWAYCRTNPFSPFPGLGLRWVSRLENHAARKYWAYKDKEAAKHNLPSSWHTVPGDAMFSDDN